MTSYTNTAKRVWEETPAGKLYVKVKKFYANKEHKPKFTDDDQRFVDISRAKSLSKERDVTEDFQKKAKELEDEYKKSLEDNLFNQLTEEYTYLESVMARPKPE
jgi:hypothetical protein